MRKLLLIVGTMLVLFAGVDSAQAAVTVSGELRIWHTVTLTFDGPPTGEDNIPNPFLDYRLNVTLTNGSVTLVVPGYYAADGDAAQTGATVGNKWRVNFMPVTTGLWRYTASFRQGANIAVSLDPNAGTPVSFDGMTGEFIVEATDKVAPDFRARGLLRYVGQHHFQFAGSGEYFLKGGADSPENSLGYVDFDATYDTGGLEFPFLHEFAPHLADWQPGDPTWGNLGAQPGRGQGLIGGLNYLSSQGVNSLYFLTYNLDGGDGADTWMWTTDAERTRFDVSKLDQWDIVFSHMTRRGIKLHVVTQEVENDELLGGSSDLNLMRQLYYRELIARFAHHPAIIWNMGEENENTTAERVAFADYIRALDPYDHPITVHSFYNGRLAFVTPPPDIFYDDLLANAPATIDATSLQGDAVSYNRWAIEYRQQSAAAGHPWAVYGDEQGPWVSAEMLPDNITLMREEALWGNLIGGGAGVEWYFGYQPAFNFGDVQSEDWRAAEPLWQDTRIALDFFQTYLPFWQMTPDNALAVWDNPGGLDAPRVLALPGQIYAVHQREGAVGSTMLLDVPAGVYDVLWYNPRTGGALQNGTIAQINGAGAQSIGQPPAEIGEDWVALVRRVGYVPPVPEVINPFPPGNLPDVSPETPSNPNNPEIPLPDINVSEPDDLELSQTVDTPFAQPGDTITWTITVENNSGMPISDVLIETVINGDVQIVDADGGVVDETTISWLIGTINAGETITLVVTTQVTSGAPFIIIGVTNLGELRVENRVLSVSRLPATGESPAWRAWFWGG